MTSSDWKKILKQLKSKPIKLKRYIKLPINKKLEPVSMSNKTREYF